MSLIEFCGRAGMVSGIKSASVAPSALKHAAVEAPARHLNRRWCLASSECGGPATSANAVLLTLYSFTSATLEREITARGCVNVHREHHPFAGVHRKCGPGTNRNCTNPLIAESMPWLSHRALLAQHNSLIYIPPTKLKDNPMRRAHR